MAVNKKVSAFVFIGVDGENGREILESIKKHKGVEYAHAIFGEYDMIAKITAEDFNSIYKVVSDLREISGVLKTETLPSMRYSVVNELKKSYNNI